MPLAGLTFLIAIAPSSPKREQVTAATDSELLAPMVSDSFRYLPDKDVYALDFDPRKVQFDLFEGWDREQDAYGDRGSLAFVSGPMYERHYSDAGREETVPLGDIKLGNRVWRARNRSASLQRAFIGISHRGKVDFGYGELTPERARRYETFIGGLHELYNDLATAPSGYKGAYSVSMGQRIRYYLPRIRMVMGLRQDGRHGGADEPRWPHPRADQRPSPVSRGLSGGLHARPCLEESFDHPWGEGLHRGRRQLDQRRCHQLCACALHAQTRAPAASTCRAICSPTSAL